MRHLITWTFILIVVTTCKQKEGRNEILTAKFTYNNIETLNCLFRMYSDSTYTFDVHEYQEFRHEKNEIFRGRYYLKGDSIVFFPMDFDFVDAETAMVKNDYLEFLDGKMPFKMKVIKRLTDKYYGVDTVTYKDYAFFSYDTGFYHYFPKDAKPYDLTNQDLAKVETVLKSCLKDLNLKFEFQDYFKQCIAVRNINNEREVWINLLCNPAEVNDLKYSVIWTHDGGECYLNLKINLDKGICYDFYVNGEA